MIEEMAVFLVEIVSGIHVADRDMLEIDALEQKVC
jgi:hypothetical protein